jgi:SAM-dependent methyltransferase
MDKKYDWPGQERRFPSISNPCKYTLDRIRVEIILFSKLLPNNSKILDFGCGEKPYYPFLKDKALEYIGIDIDESPEKNNSINTIIKQGELIPYPDGSFDSIICTQVFEHIKDMHLYARELHRILKTGGKMFISVPFSWDYHPYPGDYWRIAADGVQALFNDFSDKQIFYDTNTIQTLLQSLNLLINRRFGRSKVVSGIIIPLINSIINKINYKKGDQCLPSTIIAQLIK